MPQTCSICRHEKREEIDRALLAGEPFRNIAARFGTSPSALVRHKNTDIPATLAKAKQAAEEVQAGTLFERLKAINRETGEILREARESGSSGIALAAINRVERQLELEARLLGQLNDAKVAVGIKFGFGAPSAELDDLSHLSNEQLAERAEALARSCWELAGGKAIPLQGS